MSSGRETKSPTLLSLPLEIRHAIFAYVFQRGEGSVIIVKQQLEHFDTEIDTDDVEVLYSGGSWDDPVRAVDSQSEASTDNITSWTPQATAQTHPLALWDQTDTDHQLAAAEAGHEEPTLAVIDGRVMALVNVEDPESGEEDNFNESVGAAAITANLNFDDYDDFLDSLDDMDDEDEMNNMDYGDDLNDMEDEDELDDMNMDEDDIDDGDELEEEEEPEAPEGDIDGMKAILDRHDGWLRCSRSTKYRHTVPIIQLSDCPPPVSLLLACKQLCNEAREFYYAKCGLYIDATKSFVHFNFYETIFDMLNDQHNSYIGQLRKAHIRFVWDSETVPLLDCAYIMTEFMLPERRTRIVELLSKAPHLESVQIHWHDTVKNEASEKLKNDILNPMIASLSHNQNTGNDVRVTVKAYFPDEDQMIGKCSILGSRREEFRGCQGGHEFR